MGRCTVVVECGRKKKTTSSKTKQASALWCSFRPISHAPPTQLEFFYFRPHESDRSSCTTLVPFCADDCGLVIGACLTKEGRKVPEKVDQCARLLVVLTQCVCVCVSKLSVLRFYQLVVTFGPALSLFVNFFEIATNKFREPPHILGASFKACHIVSSFTTG